jgi:SPP1 gp7 family putative phage head morphogenesis protein
MLLQLEYGRIFDRAEAWVQKNIVGEWHRDKWAHGPRNRNHRLDASPWVEAKLRLLIAEFEDEISPQKLGPTLDLVAERVNKKADADLRGLLGVKLNQHPGTGFGAQNKFRAENLAKIRSLASAQVSELEEILSDASTEGWRVEDLGDEIKDRFEVSKSKADFLARDQTLKLNGQITQERQSQAGISRYQWSTSGDERVRPMHDDLDGTIQDWEDPPVTNEDGDENHPGGDYQCRCVAIPVLPPLDELDTPEDQDQ